MKTKEQIKSEVLSYLTKTSKHLFKIGKDLEYKIILEGDFYIIIAGDSVKVANIDTLINYYDNNTKCVIKHELFLIPSFGYTTLIDGKYFKQPAMSIPNYKLAKEKYLLISESIKGKTDKNEIQKIIKGMI